MAIPTPEELEQGLTKLDINMDRLDAIVNGTASDTVVIEGGTVPSLANLFQQIRNAYYLASPTWTGLTALVGERAGQLAKVPPTDTGTHTDPVTLAAGTPNSGEFTWSEDPAGWTRIGAAANPTAVVAAVNLSSLGVLSGSITPDQEGASDYDVEWTQARAVWNGNVVTIADQASTSLANGQVLYVDLTGSNPYAVTKATTSPTLRADFASGSKLQLLYNQSGTLVGPMAAALLAVGQAVQYDPDEIVVTIATNNVISVYVKASANPLSQTYVRFRMELVQTPDDGSPAGQADVWSLQGIYEHVRTGPTSFVQVRTLCDQGNIELAIRESGKTDSMGGKAHGDHKKSSSGLRLFIDGNPKAFTGLSAVVSYRCRTVSFTQASTLYEANTGTPASVVSALVSQRWEWANGCFDLYQWVQFERIMTLNFCMLGMLTAQRFDPDNLSFQVTGAALRYPPILYEDATTEGASATETKAHMIKLSGSNGHGFEVQVMSANWNDQELPNRNIYVSFENNRNKVYVDWLGNGHVTAVGDVLDTHVRYRLTIAD